MIRRKSISQSNDPLDVTEPIDFLASIAAEAARLTVQPDDLTVRRHIRRIGQQITSATATRRLNKLIGLQQIEGVYDPESRRAVTVWRPVRTKVQIGASE